MTPIRALVVGAGNNMLTELLHHAIHRRLPLDVVARTTDRSDWVALSRKHAVDLVLLCEPSQAEMAGLDTIRTALEETALVVVDRGGRSVCACVNDPSLARLVQIVAAACGQTPDPAPGTADGSANAGE